MLVEIIDRASAVINDAHKNAIATAKGDGKPGLKMAAEAYIQDIRSERLGTKLKILPVLTVEVSLVYAGKEGTRYKRITPVLEGLILLLQNNKLGLEIAPLNAISAVEITDPDDARAREVVYLLKFSTSYVCRTLSDEEVLRQAGKLLEVGFEYYLQDPSDDGVPDASDVVNLD